MKAIPRRSETKLRALDPNQWIVKTPKDESSRSTSKFIASFAIANFPIFPGMQRVNSISRNEFTTALQDSHAGFAFL
jgi:hypothetical protein